MEEWKLITDGRYKNILQQNSLPLLLFVFVRKCITLEASNTKFSLEVYIALFFVQFSYGEDKRYKR